jgi:integrase
MTPPPNHGAEVALAVAGDVTKPQLHLVEPAAVGWKTVAPNIQHTPGGGYRVRQRVGMKRFTVGVYPSLAAALARQAASVEAIEKHEAKGRPTLATWLPTWFEHREASDVRSVDGERGRARKHVLSSKLARIPLDDIRRADILAWLRELEAKHVDEEGQRVGWSRKNTAEDATNPKIPKRTKRRATRPSKRRTLSHQTRKHCLKLVRGALAAAVDEGFLDLNPAVGIKLRKETRTDDGSTVLAPAEWARLLAVMPEPERWIVAVAIGGGFRQGEQSSLELVDVHLDEQVPYVDVRYGAPRRRPTKSGKPRRVPVVGPALEAMRSWIANLPRWCDRSTAVVFPTKRGSHRDKKPPRGWKVWLTAAGITRRVRWHGLRAESIAEP